MAQSAPDLPPVAEHVVDEAEHELDSTQVPLGRRLSLFEMVRAVALAAGSHHLSAFSGNLAYNAFLAIVPFVLVLVSVLRIMHATDLLSSVLDVLSALLPASSAQLLREQLQAEVTSRIPDLWLLSALLAVGALWACSAAFRAVAASINVMYETSDDRPLLVQVAFSMIISLASLALLLLTFALADLVSNSVAAMVDAPFQLIWTAIRWAVVAGSAFVAFAATYAVVPRVKRPIRAIAPGALFATLALICFSLGFAFVFNEFGAILVDPLYGWFSGLFALMLYLYWSSFILLVGAEVNNTIETHGRQRPRESARGLVS